MKLVFMYEIYKICNSQLATEQVSFLNLFENTKLFVADILRSYSSYVCFETCCFFHKYVGSCFTKQFASQLYLANFYVFIGGVFVSFSEETYTVQESDMLVQLTLNLNGAIECCPVSVLLNCVNVINASSKL